MALKICYMVIADKGPALFLSEERAISYATNNHGYVVKMYGQDNSTLCVAPTKEEECVSTSS